MRRLTGGLLLALLVAGCSTESPGRIAPSSSRATQSTPSATTLPTPAPTGRLIRLLRRVEIVPQQGYRPGYDRRCDAGRACVFGPEWTDRHAGPYGRNGCDTRDDVLVRQLRDVELRWGSRCRVFDGTLVDPYTGARLGWRDHGYRIQIDHVYPLAAAWHAGAWAWPRARRVRFANDVDRELLAVAGWANQDKGAATPADWLPPDDRFHCRYLAKYLTVASAYGLPIRSADARVVRRVAPTC